MKLQVGVRQKLRVTREVPPYGYFLSDGNNDVLLPYGETDRTTVYRVDDEVDVFLFHDDKDRITATTRKALIHLDEIALLEVVDQHPKLGYFLEMGIPRQLLLPRSELPENRQLHPQIGDKVYVLLDRDKQGRMLAKLPKEDQFRPYVYSAPEQFMNQMLRCIVYRSLKIGSFVICGSDLLGFGTFGFIHESERIRPLRIGESLEARVIHVRSDGKVNLSMRPRKEIGRVEHAQMLLDHMRSRPSRSMPYTDDTAAEIIWERFQISKGAFKRALGKLLKEGLVEQKHGWTILKDNANPSPDDLTQVKE